MCGEHLFGPVMTVWFLGSSPHVRGTLMMALYQSAKKGIIPACAGNTGTILRIDKRLGDHPRMCGEHSSFFGSRVGGSGSSPHVRGTLLLLRLQGWRLGIIPACAGNTPRPPCTRTHTRDHPRMCGEHFSGLGTWISHQGSSPHVRGTPAGIRVVPVRAGIIPACAGNTERRHPSCLRFRDHPRMCGEHLLGHCLVSRAAGSSPHVRGTLVSSSAGVGSVGIIPACAGNTTSRMNMLSGSWDHPRMCGEHCMWFAGLEQIMGSSPHVRGTRSRAKAGRPRPGIIPACAGNTSYARLYGAQLRDHPRMCGEHRAVWEPSLDCLGSSPHVRGTRLFSLV